ncbi:MAG: RIP metalloprotease RseP [Stygiobacter sp.]|uniref:Zinc metalloprotease n=1 Tax=Stygiobacter electus TaxID=3032292 RepID=A0AAE3P0D5_9BACT|nr:RIP metalloprotease RseP [Stygiobacter electus]MDF1611945.1 RIP metalloprotease RseP [Stygiobacter electus]
MDYIIYFVITIAILVFVHEFGHFAAAKLSKMRVDIFAIGFGKRLFGWNKITGFTFGDLSKDFDGQGNTDYRLCLLPLGGYVKIAGMIDESFDTKFVEEEPKPYEFRAKSTLAKVFVITAGVMMNLTLAVLIFWGINFFQGKQIFKTTTIANVYENSLADKVGFKSYDKIISINDKKVNNWEDVVDNLMVRNSYKDAEVVLERNGQIDTLSINRNVLNKSMQNGFFLFPYPTKPVVVDVIKNSPAQEAGIKAGDYIIAINNKNITEGEEINIIVKANKSNVIPIVLLRNKDTVKVKVKPSAEGLIGISHSTAFIGEIEYKTYGFIGSFSQAFKNVGQYTILTFVTLKNVIVGKLAFNQAFGGPVKIAQYAVKSADTGITSFLYFLAMLSLSLAIINILPFPVLDGGHFVIILIEGLLKRELPIKVKMAIQNTGFVILLLLMAFILYSDLINL